MTYSVKSDFCTDPNAWYGNASLKIYKTEYQITGGWSNLTAMINNMRTSAPTAGMTCTTLGNAIFSNQVVIPFGTMQPPRSGNIVYRNTGNNTLEDMFNDMADWNYIDVNGNKGIIWPQYEFDGGTDVYGREYVDMFWRRDNILWHIRTFYQAGTDPTHGSELGSVYERYTFQ